MIEDFFWPKCKVTGCENGKCFRLDSEYCYPHSQRPKDKVIKEVDELAKSASKETVKHE